MSFFNFQFWNEIGIHKKVLFHSNFKMKIEWYFWCTDWYHGWDFFYLMVKSGKSFVKIGFRFQIALRNFQPPPPPSLFRPPTYFILPNVPTTPPSPPPHPPPCLFGTQEYALYTKVILHIAILNIKSKIPMTNKASFSKMFSFWCHFAPKKVNCQNVLKKQYCSTERWNILSTQRNYFRKQTMTFVIPILTDVNILSIST